MIVRAPRPQGNFYLLDKGISEDQRLSWAARGLLVFLLGKPDHWQVSPAALVNETAASTRPLGRDGVYGLMAELRDTGYITRQQARLPTGLMGPVSYLVCETPQTEKPDAAPLTGLPVPAQPGPVKTTQARTDLKQGLTTQQGLSSSAKVGFDINAGQFTDLTPELMARWSAAFPALNVALEVERAACWLICNPANRPARLFGRFLQSWLARAIKPQAQQPTRIQRAEAFAAGLFSTPQQGASNVIDAEAREVH